MTKAPHVTGGQTDTRTRANRRDSFPSPSADTPLGTPPLAKPRGSPVMPISKPVASQAILCSRLVPKLHLIRPKIQLPKMPATAAFFFMPDLAAPKLDNRALERLAHS